MSKTYYQRRKEREPDYDKKRYQRQKELHPDLGSKHHQRQKELHPDYHEKKHQRDLELHPDLNEKHYQRRLKLHPDSNKKQYQRRSEREPDLCKKTYQKALELHPDLGRDKYLKNVLPLRIKLCKILEREQIKCRMCSIVTDINLIDFDHISGDGWKDRKRFKLDIASMYKYYIQHPKEARMKLQALCRNCHRIKSIENHELGPKPRILVDDKQLTLFPSTV